MSNGPPKLALREEQPFRLVFAANGMHQFGGPPLHSGAIPDNSDIPIQLVLLLNIRDAKLPIDTEARLSTLPLYYPFKYGCGGSEIQYLVRSDSEIEILYLSDSEPDAPEEQYLQVAELPGAMFDLIPLTYEQARILGFMCSDGFFQPNEEDQALLMDLDVNNLIRIGGSRPSIANAQDIICRNPSCEFYNRRIHFQTIATVPPIPINGEDEFWYEFQGGHVEFCFGLCHYCGSVIAFNVAG